MNSPNSTVSTLITAQLVKESARLEMLPKHFGPYLSTVERMVYDFAGRLVPSYDGAFWRFYELSNGGFYMAPVMSAAQVVCENGFDGEMSADAIGITVCLFTFSHGSFYYADDPNEPFARHYHMLRGFSRSHPESQWISAAID